MSWAFTGSASGERRTAYTADTNVDRVSVVDVRDMTVVTHVQLASGASPRLMAASPKDQRLYVAAYGTDTITVIDTDTVRLDRVSG